MPAGKPLVNWTQVTGLPSPRILVPLLREDPDFSGLDDPGHWAEIQETAVARRIAAVVAYAVRPRVSPVQREWCDQILTDSWKRHDECIRQLDFVLGLLSQGGIEVLSLKGPILGRRHFPVPFLRRPSRDIDLAIRESDLERAANHLVANGYRQQDSISEAKLTNHHLVMYSSNRPRVELHTRLSHGPRGIRVDEFFGRAAVHQLPTGRSAAIPSAGDELLGLLLHFASDRFSSFFHMYELRRVWRSVHPDLQAEVISRATAHRFAAVLWLTDLAFQLVWSETFLPEGVSVPNTWLQHRLNSHLLAEMEKNVATIGPRTLARRLKGRWLDLQTTDSGSDALRMVVLILRVARRELFRI